MNFISVKIKVSAIFNGYEDNGEKGVKACGGKLNVRPAYQREFIYNDKEQQAVITSIISGFPLNTFYWATGLDGSYELMDGQQRTMSVMKFLSGEFSIKYEGDTFTSGHLKNAYPSLYARILDYEFQVEVCTGEAFEKLKWFRILNTPQKQMTEQELRNAAYAGTWLSDAKARLSSGGSKSWDDYVSGKANRQEILETAIKWVCCRDDVTIEDYMAAHQSDPDANDLCDYFTSVIAWVKDLFVDNGDGEYRKEMKQVDWGTLYHKCHKTDYPKTELRNRCAGLMGDDEVTCKKGIYSYLLLGDEKFLSIREFTESQKRTAYDKQGGICPICKKHFEINEMQGDHVVPWSKGGKTEFANLQMLCSDCNRSKGNR